MTKLKEQAELEQMTEAELAEYYYENREALAEFDEEPIVSVKPDRLDVMISARFSLTEAAEVRAAAERVGMSVSAYLRQCVLDPAPTNVIDLERARVNLRTAASMVSDALVALNAEQFTKAKGA